MRERLGIGPGVGFCVLLWLAMGCARSHRQTAAAPAPPPPIVARRPSPVVEAPEMALPPASGVASSPQPAPPPQPQPVAAGSVGPSAGRPVFPKSAGQRATAGRRPSAGSAEGEGSSPAPALSPQSAAPTAESPVSDDASLDASIARLRKGNLAYSPPPTMKMGDTVTVKARIGTDAISLDTLKAGLGGAGQTVSVVATPVSTRMKMTLTSSDFDIKALSSEEQFVDDRTPTEWSWEVSPKHPGELELHLAAVVELGSLSKDYASVDKQIAVKVNPAGALVGFFNANWQKALYAILATLAAAGWKWITDRKKKTATTVGPSQG